MPALAPPGGEVDWPAQEGTLGVVGVAPWATLDFLRAFYAGVPAQKDWHYPRVLVDANTKLPSRGRHLELGETDPSPYIRRTIAELHSQGATVVVVPCNTAHLLYERWVVDTPVPVPHIVDETARALAREGVRRAAALTSLSLRRHGLYTQRLHGLGLQAVDLSDGQAHEVSLAIDDIKRTGHCPPVRQERLRQLLLELAAQGVEGVALGCTELAGLQALCSAVGLACADSNAALAASALQQVRGAGSGSSL